MYYENIVAAEFVSRPNRFVAECIVGGRAVKAHVKNTGRCRELLVSGARVYLERGGRPGRKTDYSLIAVKKGDMLVNMDSQAPNTAAAEAYMCGMLAVPEGTTAVKREKTFGDSRFDIMFEGENGPTGYTEVKGVTLERDGAALFPDAPTERGKKHVLELVEVKKSGLYAELLFVIQFSPCAFFMPNRETHPEFADALLYAKENGVIISAYSSIITPVSIDIGRKVEVVL